MREQARVSAKVGQAFPEKLYYRIGEVARLTGLKTHVLRYWETEFGLVLPSKDRAKQRLYRRKDVELILEIKKLLYNEKYSIAGAKRKLRQILRGRAKPETWQEEEDLKTILKEVKEELISLKKLLE